MMKVSVSVTYEFPTRAPKTWKGTVEGGREHVCVSRAVRSAKVALRPVAWSSLVCVILERLDEDVEADRQGIDTVEADDAVV